MNETKIGKIIILFILVLLNCIGCATLLEDMTAYTHTAFIAVGTQKDKISTQVEHLFGKPIRELYADKNTDDELLLVEYSFTKDYNLLLFFYKNTFIQADVHKPGEWKYPDYRGDYKMVTKDSPGPAGYLLTNNGRTSSIKTLSKK